MNVYDFDKTIYDGDSAIDFYLFCLKKQPCIIKKFPVQFWNFIRYKAKRIDKISFKEIFYSYFSCVKDIDEIVILFWKKNKNKIKQWYLNQKKNTDLIISASPSFLLEPICKELNVNLISSVVDKNTGKYISNNCYGEEKVIRYNEIYKNKIINNFYSDSKSDLPVAKISKKSYIVKKNKIIEWL